MRIDFTTPDLSHGGILVAGLLDKGELAPGAKALDARAGGALARAVAASKATGKAGEIVDVLAPAGLEAARVLLVGLGSSGDLSAAKTADLGSGIMAALLRLREERAAILVDAPTGGDGAEFAANLAFGMRLRAFRFDRYKTKEKPEDKPVLARLTMMLDAADAARRAYESAAAIADGVDLARRLVSEPANVINPETLAGEAMKLADLGVSVEVLDVAAMRKLGMGSLLAVGQGSVNEPRVVAMRWTGADRDAAPVAFVGKGVTFDSGGLSLKPAKSMEDMKWDMAGSAAVIGAMAALAKRKAKVNAVGVVGLVENMPSGAAQRPGDVVTSMSGQTIEVLNTDAEGRLVLADVLYYANATFKPRAIVDLATLTGAIITALGHEHAGVFANDDALADAVRKAGDEVGEPVWRLPLGDAYDKLIRSDIADLKNIGDGTSGSIVGAQFLQHFVGETPWAHLDIAGVAWTSKERMPTGKGATGWGVRLLNQLADQLFTK